MPWFTVVMVSALALALWPRASLAHETGSVAGTPGTTDFALAHNVTTIEEVDALLAQAQAAGQLNPRLDPRLLVPSLVGQTMFLAASAPIWRSVFDAQEIDADALCAHVLALLESGLELPV